MQRFDVRCLIAQDEFDLFIAAVAALDPYDFGWVAVQQAQQAGFGIRNALSSSHELPGHHYN